MSVVRSVLEYIYIYIYSCFEPDWAHPVHPNWNCLKNLLSRYTLETKNGICPCIPWQSNAITEILTYLMVAYKDHIKHPECTNVEQVHTGNKGQGEQSNSSGCSSMHMHNLWVLSARILRVVTTLSHQVAVPISELIIWCSDSHFRSSSGYPLPYRHYWFHF